MAMSVIPPPMSTSATPSSFSSSVNTDSLAASCSTTVSATATPARFTHATMFCVELWLPVMMWTFTSRRAPVMPTGAPMPSCSSTTKSCGSTWRISRPVGSDTAFAASIARRTSSRVISRFLPATAITPRLLNPLTCGPESARCTESISTPAISSASSIAFLIASTAEAELMAGVEIDSVHLTLSGPHVKGFNSRGVIAVAGKNREVTREDVKRAIDAAKAVSLPAGREILHVLPQDFVVDEQDGIGAPVGMTGARLEVNVHIVTGAISSTQNLVACVNRAGVTVTDTVIEQLAASESVLTQDEKELGVALVDIGGGTADLAIFERGSLWHTGVVAVGGA